MCKHVSVCFCAQRYGLWDHEGPLEDKSNSPKSCKDQNKLNEDVRRKDREDREGGAERRRVHSTSTLENLEITELEQFEKVSTNTSAVLLFTFEPTWVST